MRKLVFATNNKHKLKEVRAILADSFDIISLNDIECFDEISETAETLEGNALLKAKYVCDRYGLDCFADDTGLEIEALGNAPGVYSARFAGEECDSQRNIQKVLDLMEGSLNRKACFRTVIVLIENGVIKYFEGRIAGTIAENQTGKAGFGYDPIFIPEGYDKSFAELASEEKNTISHRAVAVRKLAEYLL